MCPLNKLKAHYYLEQLYRISTAVHLPLWHIAGHIFVYAEFLIGDTTTNMTSLSQENNFQFYCMVSRKVPGKKGNAYPKRRELMCAREVHEDILLRHYPRPSCFQSTLQPGFGYHSIALSVLTVLGTKFLSSNTTTANICFIL